MIWSLTEEDDSFIERERERQEREWRKFECSLNWFDEHEDEARGLDEECDY